MKQIKIEKSKRSIFVVIAMFFFLFIPYCFGEGEPNSVVNESILKTPKQVVKIPSISGLDYYKLAKSFKKNDLPEFYEILNDPNTPGYERLQAINFIYQISDREDSNSINVLMNYIKKEENWGKWRNDIDNMVFSKWTALDRLGYFKGKGVEDFLKIAITPEGIKEIDKKWYLGVPKSEYSEESLLEQMRGFAARGLAYSDRADIQKLVRSEYEKEKQACINSGLVGDYYFNQLIEAVTRIDVIKDIGIEGHLALSDGKNTYRDVYLKYLLKYRIRKPPIDITNFKRE